MLWKLYSLNKFNVLDGVNLAFNEFDEGVGSSAPKVEQ